MTAYTTYPSLNGKSVIITGGAQGIGAEIVRAFAAQGARVGFLDLDADSGTALADSLPGVTFKACDLQDIPAMQAAIDAFRAAQGDARP